MSDILHSILIFSDGACSGNPGPGGWGTIMVYPHGEVVEMGGGNPQTTNNRMEMVGALKGLQALDAPVKHPVIMLTDSTYLIRGITMWIWGWRKRGWRNASGAEVQNRDVWEELAAQLNRLKPLDISWQYVRGHIGVPGNERCDEIAVSYSKGKKVPLFSGPLLKYPYAIHDLPDPEPLPEMKTYEKKPPAHSYLSMQGGTVMRHATWAECERRVKGQSGAKFKKAQSASDEAAILKSWGLDPAKTPIK